MRYIYVSHSCDQPSSPGQLDRVVEPSRGLQNVWRSSWKPRMTHSVVGPTSRNYVSKSRPRPNKDHISVRRVTVILTKGNCFLQTFTPLKRPKMSKPTIPPGGTFVDTLKKSFTDVPIDPKTNGISTSEFLEASESLTTLFGITRWTNLKSND